MSSIIIDANCARARHTRGRGGDGFVVSATARPRDTARPHTARYRVDKLRDGEGRALADANPEEVARLVAVREALADRVGARVVARAAAHARLRGRGDAARALGGLRPLLRAHVGEDGRARHGGDRERGAARRRDAERRVVHAARARVGRDRGRVARRRDVRRAPEQRELERGRHDDAEAGAAHLCDADARRLERVRLEHAAERRGQPLHRARRRAVQGDERVQRARGERAAQQRGGRERRVEAARVRGREREQRDVRPHRRRARREDGQHEHRARLRDVLRERHASEHARGQPAREAEVRDRHHRRVEGDGRAGAQHEERRPDRRVRSRRRGEEPRLLVGMVDRHRRDVPSSQCSI